MTTAASTRTEDFTAVLNVPASPATGLALLTSASGVSRWWGPTQGDGAVGGTLAASFGEHGVNTVRVLESSRDRRRHADQPPCGVAAPAPAQPCGPGRGTS